MLTPGIGLDLSLNLLVALSKYSKLFGSTHVNIHTIFIGSLPHFRSPCLEEILDQRRALHNNFLSERDFVVYGTKLIITLDTPRSETNLRSLQVLLLCVWQAVW